MENKRREDDRIDSEPKVMNQSDVYNYEGETIDIGEPKKDEPLRDHVEEEESYQYYQNPQVKIYQSNSSCLIIIIVLILAIIGLIFFLPLGLLILGVAIVVGLLRQLFN